MTLFSLSNNTNNHDRTHARCDATTVTSSSVDNNDPRHGHDDDGSDGKAIGPPRCLCASNRPHPTSNHWHDDETHPHLPISTTTTDDGEHRDHDRPLLLYHYSLGSVRVSSCVTGQLAVANQDPRH